MLIPEDCKYTKDHEWARLQGGKVRVGITDFAQQQLGDVVYIELPSKGDRVEGGKPFGVIESVKAVSDLVSPVTGVVDEVNTDLLQHPEWVNQDPYGKGWMILILPDNPSQWEELLDARAYESLLSEEGK
jgi:glycine cleavage system H protein